MERHNQPHERGEEFAVREMGSSAHAGPGAVGVVRGAGAFGVVQVAVDREGAGVFEVGFVEVGGPGILSSELASHLLLNLVSRRDLPCKMYFQPG